MKRICREAKYCSHISHEMGGCFAHYCDGRAWVCVQAGNKAVSCVPADHEPCEKCAHDFKPKFEPYEITIRVVSKGDEEALLNDSVPLKDKYDVAAKISSRRYRTAFSDCEYVECQSVEQDSPVRRYEKYILEKDSRGRAIVPVLQVEVTEGKNCLRFHKSDIAMMLEKFEEWNDKKYFTV